MQLPGKAIEKCTSIKICITGSTRCVLIKKPFIVAEFGTYDELMKNNMEDADLFPWDLSEEELEDEVSFFLDERPYPTK